MASPELEHLIQQMSKLPGLGKRSARRAVLHMLMDKDGVMRPLAAQMLQVADQTLQCESCGNLDTVSPCEVCTSPKRDNSTICVVEEVSDLWAFERSNVYQGLYHVLGGTLSAMEGRGPESLNLQSLTSRVKAGGVAEVVIATNATVDGQVTAHYIEDILQPFEVKVSRLAQGIPHGGELDYLDDGTLGAALAARSQLR